MHDNRSIEDRFLDVWEADDPLCRACHESGHAVAGVELGYRFDSVELDHDADLYGRVRFRIRPEEHSHGLTVLLAGVAAESLYRDDSRDPLSYGSGKEDLAAARDIAEASEGPKSIEAALQDALVIVRERWIEIQRVAAALTERKRLSEAEVFALLGRTPPRAARNEDLQ